MSSPAAATTIRVASYNTRDFLDNAGAAARVVRSIDPDVLCLQEVPRRLLASWRVSGFAERCRMYWSGHHRGSGGTTIFTSLRVQTPRSMHERLPVRLLARRRGYAVTTVALPGRRPVTVASLHLGLDAAERERHVALVLEALAHLGDVVIAGDLNESHTGRAHQAVAGRYPVVSAGLATFPSRAPQRAIDAIFASSGLDVRPGRPVDLGEGDLVAASDHRPVWVEVVTRPLDA
jgi:endonuclease/exonuclease/phosphatase family metal-dependent hydrolase